MFNLENAREYLECETIEEMEEEYSKDEILEAAMAYEGIVGYGDCIIEFVQELYGIDLID